MNFHNWGGGSSQNVDIFTTFFFSNESFPYHSNLAILNFDRFSIDKTIFSPHSFLTSIHNVIFYRHVSNEPFGIGLFLLASKFDHSCSPNCTVVFNGRTISVMAEQELKARDQPTISYVNTMLDTNTRQTALLQNWFFKCQCNVCLDTK